MKCIIISHTTLDLNTPGFDDSRLRRLGFNGHLTPITKLRNVLILNRNRSGTFDSKSNVILVSIHTNFQYVSRQYFDGQCNWQHRQEYCEGLLGPTDFLSLPNPLRYCCAVGANPEEIIGFIFLPDFQEDQIWDSRDRLCPECRTCLQNRLLDTHAVEWLEVQNS